MCLALGIVVLHIVQRWEGHLYSEVEAFVSGIWDRRAECDGCDVWFAVLGGERREEKEEVRM